MYYDDEFFERKPKKKGFNGFTLIIVALIASLIGGSTVAMLVPTMIEAGVIDISKVQTANQIQNNQQQDNSFQLQNSPQQQLNVQVNSGIVEAVEKIKPAVVGIVNIQSGLGGFFSNHQEYEAGSGSGVIFAVNGNRALVVTNHHVIEGANQLSVTLMNGEQVPATVVGYDELTDLAVIEMDASNVTTVAQFGNSDILRPGEPAIAIGNPLGLEFAQTVTVGVISATQRALPVNIGGNKVYEVNVIQTDAAINFGNSGGALVNINGELIGINSAKIASSGVEGIGFAIPIRDAEPIINDLIEHGRVQRPYLGIAPRDLNTVPEQYRPNASIKEGVIIADTPTGPAAAIGLQAYDIIVEMDGKPVDNSVTLRKILYGKHVGDVLNVVYYRGNDRFEVQITLSALPEVR
jgi:serine protease Do